MRDSQKNAPATCRACGEDLGRRKRETSLGPGECCCRHGYCMRCCPDRPDTVIPIPKKKETE